MYADFFGLDGLPFNNTPDPRFFYSTPDHEEALASLVYAVKERKGFVLLTGEVGAGKTLVSRMMLRRCGTDIAFAGINHAVHNPVDLMESVCMEFDLEVPPHSGNAKLVRILQDYLLTQFAHNTPVVLVLDEAQNLPADVFEQLRMIGNLEADDASLLQIVIVGQPELQHMFASRRLRQLRQRIFRSFHLPALNRQATGAYIRHRLAVAGASSARIFDEGAIDRVYKISRGLPRVINTVCDNAMLSAYSVDQRTIDGPFIDSVVRQMMITETSLEREQDSAGWGVGRRIRQGAARTAASTLAQPDPLDPAYQTDRSAAGLAGPSRRVTALEASAGHAPTVSDPHGQAPEPGLCLEAQNLSSCEFEPFDRRLRARFEEADAPSAAFEHRMEYAPPLLAHARAITSSLEPLVEQSRAALARTETVSRAARNRETRIGELERKVKALVDQGRRILGDIERITARTGRVERSAQAVLDRLITQTQRSRQLADTMTHVVDRIVTGNGMAKKTSAMIIDTADPVRTARAGTTDRGHLPGMLTRTRECLSDLRAFVRRRCVVSVTGSQEAPAD